MMMSKWKLPKPTYGDDYDFQPVVKLGGVVPFGYKVSEDDPDILLPIEEELLALEKAKKLLKEYSLREVSSWLTNVTGRCISHEGLRKRVSLELKRKKEAGIAKFYAERYKEALQKIEKLESRVGGKDSRSSGT